MDEINTPEFRIGFVALAATRQLRKVMFQNYRLMSDIISANELKYYIDAAILDAIEKMIQMRPQDEINAEWRKKMEFIQTVAQKF